MSNTPNQTPTTVQDVIENLDDLLCKIRTLSLKNDFELGYERALNDVFNHLLDGLPEERGCAGCVPKNTSPSNSPDQMLKIMQDVVTYTSEAFQKTRSCALGSEFQLGYECALNNLIDEARASSRTPRLAPNAPDDMAKRRNVDGYDEIIEEAFQELEAEGLIYDTGERTWSERTQSYHVVWAAVPPKHNRH
jgi:hypothetical protein